MSKSNGGVLYFTVDGEKVQVDEGVLNPDTATGITMVDGELHEVIGIAVRSGCSHSKRIEV